MYNYLFLKEESLMNIEQLLEMWSQDSKIDETEPAKEISRISSLHAKYLNIRAHNNLLVKKMHFEYLSKRKIKNDYFSGNLNNREDLEKYNLTPIQNKIHKSDMNMTLDADDDLNKILIKKIIYEELVDTCDSILKEINNRTYQLGNIVKMILFLKGLN